MVSKESFFASKESHHLLSHHHNGLCGEPAVAVIEEILERRAEKVDNKDVVKTLLSEIVDIGNSGY
jgi:hypothetical protein